MAVVKSFILLIHVFLVGARDQSLQVECQHGDIPENVLLRDSFGELNSADRLPLGSEVFYECQDPTYKLRGDESRVCTENGTWTGLVPWCEPNIISSKTLLQSSRKIDQLTDGLLHGDSSACLLLQAGRGSFTVALNHPGTVSSVVLHLADISGTLSLSVSLDDQLIECHLSEDANIYECSTSDEVFFERGSIHIESNLEALLVCELQVYARLKDPSEVESGDFESSGSSDHESDTSDVDYDLPSYDSDSGDSDIDFDRNFDENADIAIDYDQQERDGQENNQDIFDIVVISVGVILGTAAVAIAGTEIWKRFGTKSKSNKSFRENPEGGFIPEKDLLFIKHLHNPQLEDC